MLLNTHIFKLLASFVLGILLAHYFTVHWVIFFTLWSTAVIALLVLIHYGRQLVQLRKWIGIQLLVVFLLSGAFSYQYSQPTSQRKHYSHFYLKHDKVLAEIADVEQDTTGYRKMIVEVNGVIGKSENFYSVGKLLCYVNTSLDLNKGDVLIISPRITKIKNDGNPGEFDAKGYWNAQGIHYMTFADESSIRRIQKGGFADQFWYRVRAAMNSVLSKHLSPENRSVANALVLGDKSDLSGEQRNQYANAGAMHVLAVSGMHVGILLGFLQWLFYQIRILRKRGLFIISALIVVWSFAFLTGLSASVFRATLMFSVLAIGQLRGYSFFSLNALFVSGIIILFIDPNSLFSIGFQLSFLAMLGIAFFFKPISSLFDTRFKAVNYLWDGTALGISAQIGTIPISLFYFHQFPNYFIVTNLGLIILAGAALISVVVLLILFWVPVLSDLIGYVVDFVFTVLNTFISWVNGLPATISKGFDPSVLWVIITYLGITLTIYFWNRQRIRGFYLALAILFISGSSLIYQRERNWERQELVILNHSEKVIFVKSPGKVTCVYPSESMDKSDAQFMTRSYSKKMGVKAVFQPINENQTLQLGSEIKIRAQNNDWKIEYFDKSMLLTKTPEILEPRNEKIVGHGLKNTQNIDHTTVNGAVIISPSGTQS